LQRKTHFARFTGISGERAFIEIRSEFQVVGSQGRAPLEGFANAAPWVRILPRAGCGFSKGFRRIAVR